MIVLWMIDLNVPVHFGSEGLERNLDVFIFYERPLVRRMRS